MKLFWLIIAIVLVGLGAYLILNWLGVWNTVWPSIKEAFSNGWTAIQEIFRAAFR